MQGLKYIYVLFEFKHTEFFTSHGGYLLTPPNFKFLVSRLRKIRLLSISNFFVYCCHSNIDFS